MYAWMDCIHTTHRRTLCKAFDSSHFHTLALQGGVLSKEACDALETYIVANLAPKPMAGVQLYRQAISGLRILPIGCDG